MNKNNTFINQQEISHYLKDVRKETILTPDREKVLAKKILSGDITESELKSIHNELLTGNLRFVISVAKNYQGQGIDLGDLIAEGNFGLLKAIKNNQLELFPGLTYELISQHLRKQQQMKRAE